MTIRLCLLAVVSCSLFVDRTAAQDPYALRTSIGDQAYLWELRNQQAQLRSQGTPQPNRSTGVTTSAYYIPNAASGARQVVPVTGAVANYPGGNNQQAAFNQTPTRPSYIRPATATGSGTLGSAKPFQGVDRYGTPTVSPYLQLFRQEIEEAAPNYHAFVRPQLERQQERQRQQRDALQARPVRRTSTASTPSAGLHSSRFRNTGRYYSGWQR